MVPLTRWPICTVIRQRSWYQDSTWFEFLNRTAALYPDIVRVLIGEREDKTVIHQAVAKGLVHTYLTRPWNYSSLHALL